MERRLAAILAADVVGYSSLMESDEAGTFERLKAHRSEIFEPDIKLHHGRIFKLMGDGLLAEFGSVVDAAECAVAMQKAMAKRNEGLAPDKRIDIRIGVNLGDVIVEGEDRHGEGVNIAARLEQLAPPGGICVSQTVIDHLSNKLPIGFDAMGEHQVKNIAKPVAVYRAKLDGAPVKRAAPAAAKPSWAWAAMLAILLLAAGAWYALSPQAPETVVATDGKPSLVVLPFANLSDDKEQGYLADGITEDLTTELARIPGLFVISRNAAFTYKGKATQPAQIAKELGVRYILEGSVRRGGNDMRLNVQLIDAQTGGHLWAERFDGQWADIFALQDKVVGQIATALQLRLVANAADKPGGTKNPAAYDAYLRGFTLQDSGAPDDWAKAIGSLEQALALDPEYGRAAALLAWMYKAAGGTDTKLKTLGISSDEASARQKTYFEKASKHPSATYYQLLSEDLIYARKLDEAIAAAERSIALDPSDSWGYESMSNALTFSGRPQDGRDYVNAALRVDPRWSIWRYYEAGLAEFSMGRYETAAAQLEKIEAGSALPSYWDFYGHYNGLRLLIAAYGHLGRQADADAVKEKLKPFMADAKDLDFTVIHMLVEHPFKNDADRDRLVEGLRKAGVPELPARFEAPSTERLTGTEIKALVFGHTFEGRTLVSGEPYRRKTDADGSSEISNGAWSDKGSIWLEGDYLCNWLPTRGRRCGVVFRNRAGTAEKKNEYRYILPWDGAEFSVVQ